MLILLLLFAGLMSVPYLVPHLGLFSLFGIVPLLCMEYLGTQIGARRMWLWHYSAFLLWNALTTFWVCNATVGGGIFACLANAFQMSLIFGVFRWSRKLLKGILPYIFLAFMWIAWERYYLVYAQISWPWLVLGNSFARTVSLAQWYEFTGVLGGSLWIWACNIAFFGIMKSIAEGSWFNFTDKGRLAAGLCWMLLLVCPPVVSLVIYHNYDDSTDERLDVAVLQPNIDPYHKFQAFSQKQQNAILTGQLEQALKEYHKSVPSSEMLLAVAPETFTNDIVTNSYNASETWRYFTGYLKSHPDVNLMFGASTCDYIHSKNAPSVTARHLRDDMWRETHNSAFIMDGTGTGQMYHKSKLVVGVEMTPYPEFFTKIDDMLGGVMGRCVGQDEVSLLDCVSRDTTGRVVKSVPVGCAICYESVYPEHCAEYVKKGAELLAVITNDAWWGNTPGYRQHLSYSSLRAIETRKYIVRSANTGISAIINGRGDVLEKTGWWEAGYICSQAALNDKMTFFVRYGDIVGRICVFMAILLLLGVSVRIFVGKRDGTL